MLTTAASPAVAIAYPNENGQWRPFAESASSGTAGCHVSPAMRKRKTRPLPDLTPGAPAHSSLPTSAMAAPSCEPRGASADCNVVSLVHAPVRSRSSTNTDDAPGAPTYARVPATSTAAPTRAPSAGAVDSAIRVGALQLPFAPRLLAYTRPPAESAAGAPINSHS